MLLLILLIVLLCTAVYMGSMKYTKGITNTWIHWGKLIVTNILSIISIMGISLVIADLQPTTQGFILTLILTVFMFVITTIIVKILCALRAMRDNR